MAKRITYKYQASVYKSKYAGYVEWGIPYSTREECVTKVKKHAEECFKIYNKFKDDFAGPIARHYFEEYKDFTTHPVIIFCTKYVTTNTTTTESINILKD